MFGKKCEVLIHDFRNPQHSIMAIENGHVTGRKIGDPITNLALSVWKKNGYENKKIDRIINYKTKTKDGKMLKSSTVFIRNNHQVSLDVSGMYDPQLNIGLKNRITCFFK